MLLLSVVILYTAMRFMHITQIIIAAAKGNIERHYTFLPQLSDHGLKETFDGIYLGLFSSRHCFISAIDLLLLILCGCCLIFIHVNRCSAEPVYELERSLLLRHVCPACLFSDAPHVAFVTFALLFNESIFFNRNNFIFSCISTQTYADNLVSARVIQLSLKCSGPMCGRCGG